MAEFPTGWTKTLEDLFGECKVTRQPVGPPETDWARAYERSLLPPATRFPCEGDVYEALADVSVGFLTHWRAPFTGGGDGLLPKGTRIRVTSAVFPEPIGVSAQPVDDPGLEARLVPQSDREHAKYAGYSLVIKTAMLNAAFRLVGAD